VSTEKIFMFWGLLLLLVPLAASESPRDWTRVDRAFAGTCVLAEFLLLAFAPRPVLGVPVAAVATFAVSAVILGVYLAASPPRRARALRLACLVGVIDLAALVAIHLADTLSLGSMPSALVLLLFCATPIVLANFWLRNSAGSLPPGIGRP